MDPIVSGEDVMVPPGPAPFASSSAAFSRDEKQRVPKQIRIHTAGEGCGGLRRAKGGFWGMPGRFWERWCRGSFTHAH